MGIYGHTRVAAGVVEVSSPRTPPATETMLTNVDNMQAVGKLRFSMAWLVGVMPRIQELHHLLAFTGMFLDSANCPLVLLYVIRPCGIVSRHGSEPP